MDALCPVPKTHSPCLQSPPLLPSSQTINQASTAAWRTSTSTCWWRTTWAGATAGCLRSFPVNSAAHWGEETLPAPWTAAGVRLRLRTRPRDPRRRNQLILSPTAQDPLNFYQVKTHKSHLEANSPSTLISPQKVLLKNVQVRRFSPPAPAGMR